MRSTHKFNRSKIIRMPFIRYGASDLLSTGRRLLSKSPLGVWKRWSAARAESVIDRQGFGIDTGGVIRLDELDFQSPHKVYGVTYVPSPARIFSAAIRALPSDLTSFAFVDFGCGKGRAMLRAAKYGFKRIVGLDFSPELIAIGQKNLEIYKSKSGDGRLTMHEGDAAQFEIPDESCVLYFFNPFGIEVASIVFERIAASWRANPRPIYVIWCFVTEAVQPMFRAVEFVPHVGRFAPGPPWIETGFIVFRSRDVPPDFMTALGKSVSSPELLAVIKKYSLRRIPRSPSGGLGYGSTLNGMNIIIDQDLVAAIRIYAQPLDRLTTPYEHVWPLGIRKTMFRSEVRQLLGEPEVEGPFFIRYERPEFRATFELRFGPTARLESLDIIARSC